MKVKQTFKNKYNPKKKIDGKSKQNFNKKYQSKEDDDDDDDFLNQIESSEKWFEELAKDPEEFPSFTEQVLIELKDEAHKYHEAEMAAFNARNSQHGAKSDYRWLKTVLSKGTASDKIAAHVVLIQNNPIYGLNTLRNLVSMVKVAKKKECTMLIDTLVELFLNDLLPPEKKLKPFHQQPLSLLESLCSGNIVSKKRKLITWYFEDQLKEVYTSFVLALNNVGHDSVDANKEKAISAMYKLIAGHPEQEKNLLIHLINKLGDPSQKIASKAMYCLSQLLFNHPNMKQVVLLEIEKLLFRPNVSHRSQYYGICFLSQFYLSREDREIAKNLITVYFSFFKACVKKGDIDSRMMSVLLMGVNRAFPFAKVEISSLEAHINTMYKIVHLSSFNVSIHALNLLYQISNINNKLKDRFYNALYTKIICPEVGTTTHQPILLSLIFRALKNDSNISRVKVFIKRLLQIAMNISVSMACGILILISELFKQSKYLAAHDLVDRSNNSEKNSVEDNVMENNTSDTKSNDHTVNESDIKSDPKVINDTVNEDWDVKTGEIKPISKATEYNPYGRTPAFSGGEFCVYTELTQLQHHFHPTVALFATNLIEGKYIMYSGDPLRDFMPIRFFDRYVFKNPKKIEDVDKKSTGLHFLFGQRKNYISQGVRSIPVNTQNYININENRIPVDEHFLYEYLKKKSEKDKLYDKAKDDESDLESVASDEFEEMLVKMSGKKNKTDESEDELDFLNEVGDSLKPNKKNKKNDSDEDISDIDDDEDLETKSVSEDEIEDQSDKSDEDDDNIEKNDDSIEENDDPKMNSDDEKLLEYLSEDDFSDIEFSASEDESSDMKPQSLKPKSKKSSIKRNKNDLNSVFASAEEFSMMLEETGSSKSKIGGSNEMSNKDKADVKQLAWEEKRNRWISGFKKAVGGKSHNKGNFNRGSKRKGSNVKKQFSQGNSAKKMKRK